MERASTPTNLIKIQGKKFDCPFMKAKQEEEKKNETETNKR